jgi:hypothetical protein
MLSPYRDNMKTIKVGNLKHANEPDSKFITSQLKAGIRTEREHTNNPAIAKAIAKAHLDEDKHYYTKLKKSGI